METWSAHQIYSGVEKTLGSHHALDILQYTLFLKSKGLPVVFSLGHLSKITGIDYSFLNRSVNRKYESVNYNLFAISKRSGGRRFIHAVNGKLFELQRFINKEILQKVEPHPSSFAFHPSGGIRRCAEMHCECKWLMQFDLKDFFYSISEPLVFNIFQRLGYKNLLCFELARLCTTTKLPTSKRCYLTRLKKKNYVDCEGINKKPYRSYEKVGVLPQGAPTSPMLSNIAASRLDELLWEYATSLGMVYTRYADDLTFSSSQLPTRKSIGCIRNEVIRCIRENGFIENKSKFRVAGPGAKKVVLGLLVDGSIPKISRQTYKRVDRLLHASAKYGIENTARHEGFESMYGFFNHLKGLLYHIKDVDSARWRYFEDTFKKIKSQQPDDMIYEFF